MQVDEFISFQFQEYTARKAAEAARNTNMSTPFLLFN